MDSGYKLFLDIQYFCKRERGTASHGVCAHTHVSAGKKMRRACSFFCIIYTVITVQDGIHKDVWI